MCLSFGILALWVASLRYSYLAFSPFYGFAYVGGGTFTIEVTDSRPADSRMAKVVFTDFDKHDLDRLGLVWPRRSTRLFNPTHGPFFSTSGFDVPFWLLLLLTAIPTAWLWHRDRRLLTCLTGHLLCRGCGYDLTGNTSGVCPECGEKACPPAVLADSECEERVVAGPETSGG